MTKAVNSPSRHILGVAALSGRVIEHLLPSAVGQSRASFLNVKYMKWIVVVVNLFKPVIRHVK